MAILKLRGNSDRVDHRWFPLVRREATGFFCGNAVPEHACLCSYPKRVGAFLANIPGEIGPDIVRSSETMLLLPPRNKINFKKTIAISGSPKNIFLTDK